MKYEALNYEKIENVIVVRAKLTNEGEKDVEEVTQLYVSSPLAGENQPLYSLKEFTRVKLQVDESKTIEFKLLKENFELVNNEGERFLPTGIFKIYISGLFQTLEVWNWDHQIQLFFS